MLWKWIWDQFCFAGKDNANSDSTECWRVISGERKEFCFVVPVHLLAGSCRMCGVPLGPAPVTSTISPAVGIVSLASWPCSAQQTAAPGGQQFLSGVS